MVRGSMQFWHRRRASRELSRARNYVKTSATPSFSSLVAYKAGMTDLTTVDDSESPTKNMEILRPVTILEYPHTEMYGIRFYVKDKAYGYETVHTEVYDAEVAKKIGLEKAKNNGKASHFKDKIAQFSDISALLVAYPDTTSMSKNHFERFESRISAKSVQEKFDFLSTHLGKEIKVADTFKKGEEIDVMAVTKGKGFQGPIKRMGISRLYHKATQKIRHQGTMGSFGMGKVAYTVPHAGQMGYHHRTEHNKRILELGTKETIAKINIRGGFSNYGNVRNDYVVLDGSIPGPAKRLIRIRKATRTHQKAASLKEPKIVEITK